jgi:hypothetical protein
MGWFKIGSNDRKRNQRQPELDEVGDTVVEKRVNHAIQTVVDAADIVKNDVRQKAGEAKRKVDRFLFHRGESSAIDGGALVRADLTAALSASPGAEDEENAADELEEMRIAKDEIIRDNWHVVSRTTPVFVKKAALGQCIALFVRAERDNQRRRYDDGVDDDDDYHDDDGILYRLAVTPIKPYDTDHLSAIRSGSVDVPMYQVLDVPELVEHPEIMIVQVNSLPTEPAAFGGAASNVDASLDIESCILLIGTNPAGSGGNASKANRFAALLARGRAVRDENTFYQQQAQQATVDAIRDNHDGILNMLLVTPPAAAAAAGESDVANVDDLDSQQGSSDGEAEDGEDSQLPPPPPPEEAGGFVEPPNEQQQDEDQEQPPENPPADDKGDSDDEDEADKEDDEDDEDDDAMVRERERRATKIVEPRRPLPAPAAAASSDSEDEEDEEDEEEDDESEEEEYARPQTRRSRNGNQPAAAAAAAAAGTRRPVRSTRQDINYSEAEAQKRRQLAERLAYIESIQSGNKVAQPLSKEAFKWLQKNPNPFGPDEYTNLKPGDIMPIPERVYDIKVRGKVVYRKVAKRRPRTENGPRGDDETYYALRDPSDFKNSELELIQPPQISDNEAKKLVKLPAGRTAASRGEIERARLSAQREAVKREAASRLSAAVLASMSAKDDASQQPEDTTAAGAAAQNDNTFAPRNVQQITRFIEENPEDAEMLANEGAETAALNTVDALVELNQREQEREDLGGRDEFAPPSAAAAAAAAAEPSDAEAESRRRHYDLEELRTKIANRFNTALSGMDNDHRSLGEFMKKFKNDRAALDMVRKMLTEVKRAKTSHAKQSARDQLAEYIRKKTKPSSSAAAAAAASAGDLDDTDNVSSITAFSNASNVTQTLVDLMYNFNMFLRESKENLRELDQEYERLNSALANAQPGTEEYDVTNRQMENIKNQRQNIQEQRRSTLASGLALKQAEQRRRQNRLMLQKVQRMYDQKLQEEAELSKKDPDAAAALQPSGRRTVKPVDMLGDFEFQPQQRKNRQDQGASSAAAAAAAPDSGRSSKRKRQQDQQGASAAAAAPDSDRQQHDDDDDDGKAPKRKKSKAYLDARGKPAAVHLLVGAMAGMTIGAPVAGGKKTRKAAAVEAEDDVSDVVDVQVPTETGHLPDPDAVRPAPGASLSDVVILTKSGDYIGTSWPKLFRAMGKYPTIKHAIDMLARQDPVKAFGIIGFHRYYRPDQHASRRLSARRFRRDDSSDEE